MIRDLDEELNKDGLDIPSDVSRVMRVMVKKELDREFETPHEDDHVKWENLHRDCKFFDDVNGHKELDWSSVVEARKLEMAFFKKMGVYLKVSRSEVKAKGGRVISTRRVDTNKGDDKSPNYRSRFVGREVKLIRDWICVRRRHFLKP